jgi:hypothetical protein
MSKQHFNFGFSERNYKLLLVGLGINVLGFLLMIGGGSDDPNKFDASELFSNIRITVAPALIVLGYVVIIYSIMKKPQVDSHAEEIVVKPQHKEPVQAQKSEKGKK